MRKPLVHPAFSDKRYNAIPTTTTREQEQWNEIVNEEIESSKIAPEMPDHV